MPHGTCMLTRVVNYCSTLLNFSILKCKAMHVGRCCFEDYFYRMDYQQLPNVCQEKDLGVNSN